MLLTNSLGLSPKEPRVSLMGKEPLSPMSANLKSTDGTEAEPRIGVIEASKPSWLTEVVAGSMVSGAQQRLAEKAKRLMRDLRLGSLGLLGASLPRREQIPSISSQTMSHPLMSM
jgi:hypothetical protein